jgi:hypothetical protein
VDQAAVDLVLMVLLQVQQTKVMEAAPVLALVLALSLVEVEVPVKQVIPTALGTAVMASVLQLPDLQ